MIITQGANKFSGYIEYSYRFDERTMFESGVTQDDLDCMYESDTFSSLEELLQKIHPDVLNEIKDSNDANEVWISCISFKAKSEDEKTFADISLYENSQRGHVATEIDNKNITDRAFLNLQQIKRIVDNTLNEYPIKY